MIIVLIVKLKKHTGRQKLQQISGDIIYICKSKHQEMNINTMLQPESINICCQKASHGSKNCVNQKIRTFFFKTKPCIFIKCKLSRNMALYNFYVKYVNQLKKN